MCTAYVHMMCMCSMYISQNYHIKTHKKRIKPIYLPNEKYHLSSQNSPGNSAPRNLNSASQSRLRGRRDLRAFVLCKSFKIKTWMTWMTLKISKNIKIFRCSDKLKKQKKTDRFEYEEFGAPRSPSLEQFRTHFVVVRFSTPESRNAPTSQHLSFKLKIRKWSTQCTKFSTQKVEDNDRQCPFRCFPAFLYFYISYISYQMFFNLFQDTHEIPQLHGAPGFRSPWRRARARADFGRNDRMAEIFAGHPGILWNSAIQQEFGYLDISRNILLILNLGWIGQDVTKGGKKVRRRKKIAKVFQTPASCKGCTATCNQPQYRVPWVAGLHWIPGSPLVENVQTSAPVECSPYQWT